MAAISSLGAGSGLDLAGILTNLMSVEQQPLLDLQRKEASYQTRISALGSLKGALSTLQSSAAALVPGTGTTAADKYASYSASVADSSIASASATSSSVPGVYSLEVSQLAQSQRLASDPAVAHYDSASSPITTGTLTIDFGKVASTTDPDTQATTTTYTADAARKLTVTIDSSNATLGGLRDAINAANGGVTATIVTGTAGAQLVLASKNGGNQNVMRLSGIPGFEFDPADPAKTGFTQDSSKGGQAAQDAQFTLNGIAATSSTNSVSGVLDGVSLTLTKTNVGSPTTITVRKDSTSAANTALAAFIKSYNDANSAVSDLGSYNADTKIAGPLQGQAVLRSAQTLLRQLVFNTTAGGNSKYQRLSDIGISLNKDGSLAPLDTTKLNNALTTDYAGVTSLIAKVGSTFKSAMDSMVGTNGAITGATDSTNAMIKSLDSQQTVINTRLASIQARYTAQFTALDTLIAGMKQTSSYLTQQLASLPSAA